MRFRNLAAPSNKPQNRDKVGLLQPGAISVLICQLPSCCSCQEAGKIFLSELILRKVALLICLKSPSSKISFSSRYSIGSRPVSLKLPSEERKKVRPTFQKFHLGVGCGQGRKENVVLRNCRTNLFRN